MLRAHHATAGAGVAGAPVGAVGTAKSKVIFLVKVEFQIQLALFLFRLRCRYATRKKKEAAGSTTLDGAQAEIDRWKQELSKKHGETLNDWKKMYEGIVRKDGPSFSFSSWETEGKKKGGEKAKAKSQPGRGKGGGGS